MHVVRDGEECMLLDLRTPRMNELEVLEASNTNGKLRGLPVVVLTASDNATDVDVAYARRCSG